LLQAVLAIAENSMLALNLLSTSSKQHTQVLA